MIDLLLRLEEPSIRHLISLSVGFPTPFRTQCVCDGYTHEPNRLLQGDEEYGSVVGFIDVEITAPGEGLIHHMAVLPTSQRRGIGRAMVAEVCAQLSLRRRTAETDDDAVDFYRRCGFEVERLGEQYPGVVRYRCVLDLIK